MRKIQFIAYLSLLLLAGACTTINYTPRVSLDVSRKTIHARIQVDKLVDVSPPDDRLNPFLGASVTNYEAIPAGLELDVTNAIASDFANNGLFTDVGRKLEQPDFIIKGEIKKFMGKSEMNTYGKISWGVATASLILTPILNKPVVIAGVIPMLGWYFGIPISKNTATIEITLQVIDKNQNLVGTYVGKASETVSSNMYKNKLLAIPALTNKMFSTAVAGIREQILADAARFEAK